MANNEAKIIAIVGVPGAGKTLAAKYFKEQNIPVLRFGAVTDEGLQSQGLALTEENERSFRERLRKDFGMAAYAVQMESKILRAIQDHSLVVIDGLRSWEEYVYLKQKFQQLILLAIYAPPTVRYWRLASRQERRLSVEEARQRDIAELTGLNMGPPIAIADYLIVNDASVEVFYEKLNTFLEMIGQDKKNG